MQSYGKSHVCVCISRRCSVDPAAMLSTTRSDVTTSCNISGCAAGQRHDLSAFSRRLLVAYRTTRDTSTPLVLIAGPHDGRRFTRSASRLAMRNADVTSEAQFATTVRIRSSIDVISDWSQWFYIRHFPLSSRAQLQFINQPTFVTWSKVHLYNFMYFIICKA